MRKLLFLVFVSLVLCVPTLQAQSNQWVTAYYAGWSQGRYNNGVLPAEEIDFSALTHIIHFAILPDSGGSLDTTVNNLVGTNSEVIVSRAHTAGKKVLICIGGWGSNGLFREATNLLNRSRFIDNLVGFMLNRGYDGIDIDWEPLETIDIPQFTLFIAELRLRLDAINPRPLLTTAVNYQAPALVTLFNLFDQINIMTYDMSGAWPGWVTWHTAPLYNGGSTFPSTGGPLPSANDMVGKFISAGIPSNKLGIGIPFYGYVWNGGGGTPTGGVTMPRQTWTIAPKVLANVPYTTIIQQYYQNGSRRWDDVAETSYLSIDKPDSTQDKFISFDDELAIWKKFEFMRANNLGGVFIWELGGGHRTDLPTGQRDKLLQSVKQAYYGTPPQIDAIPPVISLISPANEATVSGTLSMNANANDDVGVIGVLFKADGKPISNEDTVPPYTVSFNTTLLTNGPHTIAATARDAAGNTSSSVISVTVLNIPAVPTLLSPPDGATDVELTPTLRWNASANATSYDIEVSTVQDFSVKIAEQLGLQTTSLVLTPLLPNTLYFWRVRSSNAAGTLPFSPSWRFTTGVPTSVDDPPSGIPSKFLLFQNYPNPFNHATMIMLGLPESAEVNISISDVLGQTVARLPSEHLPAGYHLRTWDGTTSTGDPLSSGIYFCCFIATGWSGKKFSKTVKMTLVR